MSNTKHVRGPATPTTHVALIQQSALDQLRADLATAKKAARQAQGWLDIANELNKRMETECAQRLQRCIDAGAALRADLATAQAAAEQWQGKYMELREIVLLVEDFADNRDEPTAMALIDAFNAFRALVEGHTPRQWLVAEPGDAGAGAEAPWGEVIDEWEAPRRAVAAGEGAPW